MPNKIETTSNLQKKSHEALLKVLNNIGVIGAILAAIADIVFVIIMVLGVKVKAELSAIIIFAIVNALIGILINILLRYQGQKYAEIENSELCKKFYHKRVKEHKYMSMGKWMTLKSLEDFLVKGITTTFSIFGIIYISITGSKNPIQILITIATLILFACFGLMGMNSAYERFYNIQVPFMQTQILAKEGTKLPTSGTSQDSNEIKQDILGNGIEVTKPQSDNEIEALEQKLWEETLEEVKKENKDVTNL